MKSAPLLSAGAVALFASAASAHYGMIIPADNMVTQDEGRSVALEISFSHPFEKDGMILETPVAFTVTHDGETKDVLGDLTPATIMDKPGFTLEYALDRPGSHVFAMTPTPYWEPEEDAFITHFTKTYVSAYGDDEGWDAELGLKTEIVPLTKPFALWEANVFQGIVKLDGEPIPYAEVEVEFYNEDGAATAPSELMVTQTVKADGDGVFTYAAPEAGWWGFAALTTADEPLQHEGVDKDHELGAVIWVKFEPWTRK